jgi:nucleotide-binding universal stress UspA family protein
MKKILVPIDFSKQSEFASKVAHKIAKKTGSSIYLIHLIELPSGVVDMGSGSRFNIQESMLYLRKTKQKIITFKEKFFSSKLEIHHIIKLQNPYEGILKYADKLEVDLIVMGSKGHSEFEEILIGSNTEKVVRTSKRPVIVVKKDDDTFKIKDIVYASSFKKDDKEAFHKFLNFANQFKSKIHLLKINTANKFESTHDAIQNVKDFIKEFDLPKHSINIYSDTSVEKGILNFSRELNADLIALSTHGRSGISHFFSGSVTKNLSKSALKPMLTFRV